MRFSSQVQYKNDRPSIVAELSGNVLAARGCKIVFNFIFWNIHVSWSLSTCIKGCMIQIQVSLFHLEMHCMETIKMDFKVSDFQTTWNYPAQKYSSVINLMLIVQICPRVLQKGASLGIKTWKCGLVPRLIMYVIRSLKLYRPHCTGFSSGNRSKLIIHERGCMG